MVHDTSGFSQLPLLEYIAMIPKSRNGTRPEQDIKLFHYFYKGDRASRTFGESSVAAHETVTSHVLNRTLNCSTMLTKATVFREPFLSKQLFTVHEQHAPGTASKLRPRTNPVGRGSEAAIIFSPNQAS